MPPPALASSKKANALSSQKLGKFSRILLQKQKLKEGGVARTGEGEERAGQAKVNEVQLSFPQSQPRPFEQTQPSPAFPPSAVAGQQKEGISSLAAATSATKTATATAAPSSASSIAVPSLPVFQTPGPAAGAPLETPRKDAAPLVPLPFSGAAKVEGPKKGLTVEEETSVLSKKRGRELQLPSMTRESGSVPAPFSTTPAHKRREVKGATPFEERLEQKAEKKIEERTKEDEQVAASSAEASLLGKRKKGPKPPVSEAKLRAFKKKIRLPILREFWSRW